MQTAVVGLILVAALVGPVMTAQAQPPAYVTRVVDGDTLYAEVAGRIEAVRYLGINTPRIEHPSNGPGRYAAAAYEANRRLVEGQWVYLLFEGPARDRHGRLLAYVWVGSVFVNATLVHSGYGEAALASHAGYAAYFRLLQDGAQRDGRGLWREPDAQIYHRPRPTELAADEEGGPAIVGGRVFSAPAPFLPAASSTPVGGPAASTPAVSTPAVGTPGSRTGSPSYVGPRRSLVR
jgi:endonuclease YncB( thermonuclease family)